VKRLAVVGGGVTGLDLACRLARRGYRVTLFERDRELGGLAGSFDLRGRRLEKFYHFLCRPDLPYLERLGDLGLADRVRWKRAGMAYYLDGRLHSFSTPWALLALDRLSLRSRLRYGWSVVRARFRRHWRDLEDVGAIDWLRREIGDEAYELLWSSLLELKFHEHAGEVSAAWLWTRIRRVAESRRLLLFEELGYVDGGSDVLVAGLERALAAAGGEVRAGEGVRDVRSDRGRVEAVVTARGEERFDAVLSTAPLRVVGGWPGLPEALRRRYLAIRDLGVLCSILVLDRPYGDVFWLNANDRHIPLAGAIEYTRLNPLGGLHVLYVPEYLPADSPRFRLGAEAIVAEHVRHLGRIRPGFDRARVVDAFVYRAGHSQPVYGRGFSRLLPPIRTEVGGFYAADTCHFFPNDRSIAESIVLAGRIEAAFLADE
jgi:protoporphyrinogen oxidase